MRGPRRLYKMFGVCSTGPWTNSARERPPLRAKRTTGCSLGGIPTYHYHLETLTTPRQSDRFADFLRKFCGFFTTPMMC